jgi:hypothetical protein
MKKSLETAKLILINHQIEFSESNHGTFLALNVGMTLSSKFLTKLAESGIKLGVRVTPNGKPYFAIYDEDKTIPTQEQTDKIEVLKKNGYVWNQQESIAAAGVVMRKGKDFWFFGLDGEIMHNPVGSVYYCNV